MSLNDSWLRYLRNLFEQSVEKGQRRGNTFVSISGYESAARYFWTGSHVYLTWTIASLKYRSEAAQAKLKQFGMTDSYPSLCIILLSDFTNIFTLCLFNSILTVIYTNKFAIICYVFFQWFCNRRNRNRELQISKELIWS